MALSPFFIEYSISPFMEVCLVCYFLSFSDIFVITNHPNC